MYEFTYTNALGESIYISNMLPFVLESVEGISNVSSIIQTEKAPYQDGSTYIDTLLDSRLITFVCQIRTDIDTNRRKAIRILNPKLGKGVLSFSRNGVTRTLECVVDDSPNMVDSHDGRLSRMQRFSFTLEAHQPYWEDGEQTWTLASFIGGMEMPFSFPITLGVVGSKLTVENDGDTVSPLFIDLMGPLTNPKISNNSTGEFIAIVQNIQEGYSLEINTEKGKKSVVIISPTGERSNGFHFIDPDSTLFGLAIGKNELEYTADYKPNDNAVIIYYKNRFIGV